MDINRISVPTVILADPEYPLLSYLMKPYSDVRVAGRRFNYTLKKYRMVVECVCG